MGGESALGWPGLEQRVPRGRHVHERMAPPAPDLVRGVGREAWRRGAGRELHDHPIEQRGERGVAQGGLRDTGDADQVLATARPAREQRDRAGERRHRSRQAPSVDEMAALAVEGVVKAPSLVVRPSAHGERRSEDDAGGEDGCGSSHDSVATPSTSAVEQWYAVLAVPKHQTMSLFLAVT